MNLYQITLEFNSTKHYIICDTMINALIRAGEKYKDEEIIGILLISENVD